MYETTAALDAISLNSLNINQLDDLDPVTRDLVLRRSRLLGPSYRLHYDNPVHAVRALGTKIWDSSGVEYLDAYNNVVSIGHANPRVIDAVTRQLGRLNVHTRYLQDEIIEFAEQLLGTFDEHLDTVMITCTGSEANDLAVRMARHVTGGTGVIASEYAYHGSTSEVASWSPSSGRGVNIGSHVRLVPPPDPARFGDLDGPQWFASHVEDQIEDLARRGVKVAALVLDSLFSSDGIYPVPEGFLDPAVAVVHRAGGVVISDEVQSGHARTGSSMWGYQRAKFEPDIATMGKPMGNGMPIAGVVARSSITTSFGNEVSYFNTFGGNTAMIAAAQTVLDVIQEDNLLDAASRSGDEMQMGLRAITATDSGRTSVRGAGLYIGVEYSRGDTIRTPDPARAAFVVNELRRKHVLISAAGPYGNVLKIRPPLVFSASDVERFLEEFSLVTEMVGLRD